MKAPVYLFIVAILFTNCTPKKTPNLVNGILLDTIPIVWTNDTAAGDFVLDTTLQRLYLEESEDTTSLNEGGEEVTTAAMAFEIAEPILIGAYGKENISLQKPFHINLVDDIWVIYGTLPKADGRDALGGTAYIEIRKKNGGFVKSIHGE